MRTETVISDIAASWRYVIGSDLVSDPNQHLALDLVWLLYPLRRKYSDYAKEPYTISNIMSDGIELIAAIVNTLHRNYDTDLANEYEGMLKYELDALKSDDGEHGGDSDQEDHYNFHESLEEYEKYFYLRMAAYEYSMYARLIENHSNADIRKEWL